MRTVTAIVNQKGGAGKTTTSINLASAIAMRGHEVLLIDMDPQANSTGGLGIYPDDPSTTMAGVLMKAIPIKDIIFRPSQANFSIAPAHIELEEANQKLAAEVFKEKTLSRIISGLDYPFILIDCPPALGNLTIISIFASTTIIVPCEISKYSLDGFASLMRLISSIKDGASDNNYLRLLLTKYDQRNAITNEWVLKQLEPYKYLLFQTMIRKNEALNQAPIAEKPIFAASPGSFGAQDYESLAEEFLSYVDQKTTNGQK